MSEQSAIEEKALKVRAIEATLQELGMSKQELIDLVQALLAQSISKERVEEISQHITSKLGIENNSDNFPMQDIAVLICEGKTDLVTEFLSFEELETLKIKLGLAQSIKRAQALGILIDHEKLAKLLSLESLSKITINNVVTVNNKHKTLSAKEAAKVSQSIDDEIELSGRSSGRSSEKSHKKQPAKTNILIQVIGAIRTQAEEIGNSVTSSFNQASSAQQQQQQQQQIRRSMRAAERAERHMRRQQRELQRAVPGLSKVHSRGGDMFATVRTKTGQMEVNVREYLRDNNRLTPRSIKILDAASSASSAVERSVRQISRGLPSAKSFNFDANGSLQIGLENGKELNKTNVKEYVSEAAVVASKLEARKGELEAKKSQLEAKSAQLESAIRQKDISRGPELDSSNMIPSTEQMRDPALKYYLQAQNQGASTSAEPEKQNSGIKESKRTMDELVKLDALHDKEKVMEDIKGVKSSMEKVMANMDEAMKNENLIKELSKKSPRDRMT